MSFGVAITEKLDSFPRSGQGVNHNRVKFQRHMRSSLRPMTPQRTGSAISFMTKTSFLRSLIAVTAFLAAGQAALAQSPQCQRFQAELAALDAAAGGGAPTGADAGPAGGDQPSRRLLPQHRLRARPPRLPRRARARRMRLDRPADPPARGRLCPPRLAGPSTRARSTPAAVSSRSPSSRPARPISRAASSNRSSAPRASSSRSSRSCPKASRSSPMTDRPPSAADA